MKPSMSAAWVRKVWKRTTWRMLDPAASSTARTFSKAWRVWATASPGPTSFPARSAATCPATTTSSPPGAIMPCEYSPNAGPGVFEVTALTASPASAETNVLEIGGLAVDAAGRRRDPVGDLAALGHRLHEAAHVGLVLVGGEPVAMARVPLRLADDPPVRRHLDLREGADGAPEAAMGQGEREVDTVALDDLVPAVQPALAVRDVVVAEPLVERDERALLAGDDLVPGQRRHRVGAVLEPVIVLLLGLLEAALQAHGVEVGRVGGDLGAEQVERDRAVEVDVLLDGGQVHPPVAPHVVGLVLPHDLAGPLHDAPHPALAHEHVVGFLGQHEAAGARQRVEAALGQARELVLAVPVGEEAEHEEREPVRRPLVEGAQDAGLVVVPGAALQQRLRLLAAVAPEVGVEDVHHRPQVAALLHVDLEEVAQIVERRARPAEVPLLLDRRGLGISLRHDQPSERPAVLAGHLLPRGLAQVVAEVDMSARLRLGEEDAPAVLRHPGVVELGPALGVHAGRGAQVGLLGLEALRPHVLPPLEELGLPVLEGAQQPPVLGEVDVVGDPLVVVDGRHHTLLRSKSPRSPVPYTLSAPLGPTALGRWKIQFCHAESRAKILLSSVSGPPKRSEASMPVSASGENAARSSMAIRTSSSQSMSSGVNVTSPASAAAAASRSSPVRPFRSSTRPGSSRNRLCRRVSPLTVG